MARWTLNTLDILYTTSTLKAPCIQCNQFEQHCHLMCVCVCVYVRLLYVYMSSLLLHHISVFELMCLQSLLYDFWYSSSFQKDISLTS